MRELSERRGSAPPRSRTQHRQNRAATEGETRDDATWRDAHGRASGETGVAFRVRRRARRRVRSIFNAGTATTCVAPARSPAAL